MQFLNSTPSGPQKEVIPISAVCQQEATKNEMHQQPAFSIAQTG